MRLYAIRKQEFPNGFRADMRHAPRGNPAAGRDGQDARATGGMDAIQNMKTMAGSPDAEFSASRNLAHGFCVSGVPPFVNR
jgi:hypothetical protein